MGRRCFLPWGFRYFQRGWEERSGAADAEACSAAPRSYLCSSQFGLSTNWGWLCKIGPTAQSFVGSFIYWSQWTCHCGIFKMGCDVIPWTAQTQGETRLKPNDLRIQRVCSESFQWDTFPPEDAVKKKLSCSSPCELWTNFFTFSPELCKIECKTIIKAVTGVKWEGKLVWPVYRGMVSCRPGSQTPQCSSHTGRGVQSLHVPQKAEKSP